ncbi:MAG: hypothetical protein EP343_11505 [Deltaproteobacteria bacterium]|nr:MAG: hypothetical protein EP343_11505 [Deltaproteobacteria bacterium]
MFRAEAKHPAVSPFPTNTGGTIPPVTSRNRPLQGVPVTNFCEVKVDLKRLLLEENKQKNIQNIEHVKGNVLVHYRWVLWKNGSPRASGARGVIPVGDKVRVISLDRLGNPLIAPPHITENHYVVVTLTGPYPNKIKRPSYKIELSGKAIRLRVANIYTRGLPSGGARTNAESSLNPQKTMDFTGEDLKSSNTWFVFSRLPGGYRYYVTVTVNANEATNPKKAQQQATPPSNGGKSKKAENGGGAAGGNASTGGNSSGDSSPERNENSGSSKSTKHSFFVYPVYRFRPQLGVVVSFSTTGSKIRPNLFNSPVQYSSKGGFLSATPEPVSASFLIGTLIYLHERDIYDPHCPVGVGILLGMGANERIFRDYYLGIGLEIRGAAVISVGFRFTLSEQLPEGLTAGMPYDGTIGTLPIRPTVGGFVSLTFDPIILVTALGDYIQERIAKWSKPKSN